MLASFLSQTSRPRTRMVAAKGCAFSENRDSLFSFQAEISTPWSRTIPPQRKKEAKIERAERFKQRQLKIDEIPVQKEDKRKRLKDREIENNTITEDQIKINIATKQSIFKLFLIIITQESKRGKMCVSEIHTRTSCLMSWRMFVLHRTFCLAIIIIRNENREAELVLV